MLPLWRLLMFDRCSCSLSDSSFLLESRPGRSRIRAMFLKLLLLGASRVGKSSLLSRFCSGRAFEPGYIETPGPDFNGTRLKLQSGLEAVLQIWDLPGSDAAMTTEDRKRYWKDVHVAILVCDMCNKDSFLVLDRMRSEVLAEARRHNQADSISFALLINKAEPTHARKQQVFASDVLAWCSAVNIRHFYETSAMSDTNCLIALVNLTQLAADMDMQRRGVRVACDKVELARQEAKEAAEAAAKAAAEAAAAAAAKAAADAAAAALAKAEQDRLDAEAKRAADFEARWEAQRLAAEAAALKEKTEKAAAAARAKDRAEKRRANIAQSAYGGFKQRPHRLNAVLIHQHAQASGIDPAALGIAPLLPPALSTSVSQEDEPAPPASARIHKLGALPPALNHAPKFVPKRVSNLGVGTGAMLRQQNVLSQSPQQQQLDAVSERNVGSITPHSAAVAGASTGRQHKRGASFSQQQRPATQDSSSSNRLQPHAPPTPPVHGSVHSRAGSSRALHRSESKEEEADDSAADHDAAASSAVTAAASTPVDPVASSSAASVAAPLPCSFPPVPVLDPLYDPLLDLVLAQVPRWTRSDLARFFHAGHFEAHPEEGMGFKHFRKLWQKVSANAGGMDAAAAAESESDAGGSMLNQACAWRVPAVVERVFAAMDRSAQGRVDFEQFMLGFSALSGMMSSPVIAAAASTAAASAANAKDKDKASAAATLDAGAKFLFRVFDFRSTRFLAEPLDAAAKQHQLQQQATASQKEEGDDASGTEEKESSSSAAADADTDSSSQQQQPAPLTQRSFLIRQRRELQGLERFPFDMYDAAEDSAPAAAAKSAFITRECIIKLHSQVAQSLPAFHALLQLPSSTPATDGSTRSLDLARRLHPFVAEFVAGWFQAAGHEHAATLSEMQWRAAVQRRPEIIQPFAPHKLIAAAAAAAAAAVQ